MARAAADACARSSSAPSRRPAARGAARLVRVGDRWRRAPYIVSPTDSERLTFLRARGYEIDAESDDTIYHLTALGSLAEPAAPDGYRLRTIEPTDLEQRVEIHRTVWTPSRVTAESFANVQAAWPYRRDLDCVVEAPDGSFAAYCLAWLDDANRVGEFEPVGTHPDYHRRGLATAVCRFALLRLRGGRHARDRLVAGGLRGGDRALRVDRHARARALGGARQATLALRCSQRAEHRPVPRGRALAAHPAL